ncbi:NAD-dependent epimerase/dehydratase family protein [Candidatus Bathyarchaeota archaeon]|nr:NAD-dependent epimerase/dehydratase family protein [Candidatus Bathyarchaeota archaeon]
MVSCFVTGGTGFIGRYIVRLHRERGHEVTMLVRGSSDTSSIDGLGAEFKVGDVSDGRSVLEALPEDCEWFFHNAAVMSDWGPRSHFAPVNVEGVRNVLETVRKRDVPALIHTSSTAVYGLPDTGDPITEDMTVKPSHPYQESKYLAEALVREYGELYGVEAAMVRPPTVLGGGDMYTGPMLIDYIRRGSMTYFGDGRVNQSYVHAEDVAACLIKAAERFSEARGRAYNVTSFMATYRALVEALSAELGVNRKVSEIPYAVADALGWLMEACYGALESRRAPPLTSFRVRLYGRDYVIDDSRARTELGYTPRWVLTETVRDMVENCGTLKPR